MKSVFRITGCPLYRSPTKLQLPFDKLLQQMEPGQILSLTILRENGRPAVYLASPLGDNVTRAHLTNGAFLSEPSKAPVINAKVRMIVLRGVSRTVTGLADGDIAQHFLTAEIDAPLPCAEICRALLQASEGAGITLIVQNTGPLRGNRRMLLERQTNRNSLTEALLSAPAVYQAAFAVFGAPSDCSVIAAAAATNGLAFQSVAPVSCTANAIFAVLERMQATEFLRYMFLREELRLLGHLCTDGTEGNLPVNKDTVPNELPFELKDAGPDAIRLGKTADGRFVSLPSRSLLRHFFVGGTPGSGKGNLLFGICAQLAFHKVPFLVIESAKNEFHYLQKVIPDLNTFRSKAGEYTCNPFALPKGVRLSEYKPALQETLRACFRLDGPLEELFNSTLEKCFADAGYNDDSRLGDPGTEPFGLHEFMQTFEKMLRQSDYSQRVGTDMRAAGLVRLEKLISLNRSVYDTFKTVQPEVLVSGQTVLQLNALTSVESKQLFCTMLLISIGAYLRLTRHSSHGVRLVIVLDEAHNLLKAVTATTGEQYSFADDFLAMMLELRSIGVGFIVCDQSADNLPPMISGVCDTKVFMGASPVSGVGSEANRRYLRLDDEGADHLFLLKPGDGLFSTAESGRSFFFHTPNVIDLLGLEQPLEARNAYLEQHPELLACPYKECMYCPAVKLCSVQIRHVAASNAICLTNHNERFKNLWKSAELEPAYSAAVRRLFTDAEKLSHQNNAVFFCTLINYLRNFNRRSSVKLPPKTLMKSAVDFLRNIKRISENK